MGVLINSQLLDQHTPASLLGYGLVALVSSTIIGQIVLFLTSKIRHIPGPFWAKISSLWLVSQCRKTRRSVAVMEQHDKYGSFVRIAPNHVSINDPSAVAQIYGHKTGFTKSDFYDAFVQVRPVLFNTRDGATHTRKKKYMNPAFSARALAEFEPHMNVELLAWKRQLLRFHKEVEGRVDFVVWTNYLAFDVIGSFSFGRPFGFIEKGNDPYNLIRTIDMRGEVLNALGSLTPWLRPFMKYYFVDPFWPSGLKATADLEKIGREAFLLRKESADDRRDLLSYLLAAADAKNKDPIDENEIIAESISFIVGGSDTTSSTMTNFIDMVSRNPTIQSRLQQELDEGFPGEQADDWVPEERQVAKLQYLVAVLREVMRLRPTSATGLERITPAGGKMVAGKFIPEETVISVPTCGVMMNPQIFKCPTEFMPERWLDGDSTNLIDHFFPFSTGPRACIGRNFAWMEILKAMALLFKLFDVERLNDKPTMIREGFFNKAAECEVKLRKRP